jgi:hypothetical protein
MSKLPITRIRGSVPQAEDDRLEVIETREGAQGFGAFCNFRYSYTEVSAFGGKARVKSRRASFEEGKLVSESFEADLSRDAYDQVVGQGQQLVHRVRTAARRDPDEDGRGQGLGEGGGHRN